MSDQKLLNENEIRHFMRYADMQPLAETFLEKEGYGAYKEDEEAPADDMGDLGGMDMSEPPGDDLPGEDLPGEELPPEEPGETAQVDVEAMVADFAEIIKKHTGTDISVESEPEAPMDAPAPEEEEMPMDEPVADGDEEVEESLESANIEITEEDAPAAEVSEDEELDEEEMVNEVARRVASRLLKLQKEA
jgi:hypothetical protein